MGSENEAEQSFERPCRFAAVGPSRHTISPHPSSREGHHPPCGGARVLLIGFDVALLCCRSLLPGPAELGAINPDAMHDDCGRNGDTTQHYQLMSERRILSFKPAPRLEGQGQDGKYKA